MVEVTHNKISSTQNVFNLSENWQLIKTEADQYATPNALIQNQEQHETFNGIVPGSVAMAVNGREPECWEPSFTYENFDWWYIYRFNDLKSITVLNNSKKLILNFEGLATLSEIWLNDKKLLSTNNMFRQYSVELGCLIKPSDKLILVFRSLNKNLEQKRPRPRWKTKLVDNQQMRWLRCTVLGQVSAWTPPIQMIGPWKAITIEQVTDLELKNLNLKTYVEKNTAIISISLQLESFDLSKKITSSYLLINDCIYPLNIKSTEGIYKLSIIQQLTHINFWWPHTHGTPHLYDYEIILETTAGKQLIRSGKVGFKSVQFSQSENKCELLINNQLVFCRGSCWTVSDYLSLNANKETLTKQLTLMRDAGLNMVRVGGTMVYESNHFYELCNQLGLLVWQDFMFASMDYPTEDIAFVRNIQIESIQQLNRLSHYVCISNYCGNTDVQAQAAMYGMPEEIWSNDFFENWLAQSCQEHHPGIPYLSSSPSGGALPFHLSEGISHYWGIGAYMHPTNDPDKTRVLFASEGMGLSHIPEDETIQNAIGKTNLFPYNNDWTKRIPRDLGAGWDFDDIRDNYLEELFNLSAVSLRRQDVERYIALSRVVTGEVISKVFEYWRSNQSPCQGGLIWFNRDFWPCAGFGLIDSHNRPKAAYFQIKRAWTAQTLFIHNEGLDGASIKVINDKNQTLIGSIEVELIKNNQVLIAKAQTEIKIKKHQQQSLSVDRILGQFFDTGYAYKFGTPPFDILCCRLKNKNNKIIAESFLFAKNYDLPIIENAEISATVELLDNSTLILSIQSNRFLQFVKIITKNHLPSDNYFHISPGHIKRIKLTKIEEKVHSFKGRIEAINLKNSIKININE